MAHVRQSRTGSGIGFEVGVLQPLKATSDETPAQVPEFISQKVFTTSYICIYIYIYLSIHIDR